MVTVEEAFAQILNEKTEWPVETVKMEDSLGRILAENIAADRDFPPYNRITMDGIAIDFSEYEKGRRKFKIEGIQFAGEPVKELSSTELCFEVMTGGILPVNTDTVIRYEDITIEEGFATVNIEDLTPQLNVHHQGNDRKASDVIVDAYTEISPSEIAVMATVGKTEVKVYKRPEICIVSTGDELVNVNEKPEPYQIRTSNSPSIKSALERHGYSADLAHLPDNRDTMRKDLFEILKDYDVVFLTGGVSKGKKDYVPEILEEAGVNKLFHRVKQRPGKPFWFGKNENTTVFALPGNPVSTFMCFHRYALPWLKACDQLEPVIKFAVLSDDFEFNVELTYFLQVKIHYTKEGKLEASPIPGHGSGDHANLVDADAFLELPLEKNKFKKGEVYPVIFYR